VFGFLRLLQHLVVWGIDLQVQDETGLTALHYAHFFQQQECIAFLLRSGANRFVLDHLGRTPSDLGPQLDGHPILDSLDSPGDSHSDTSSHHVQVTDCHINMPAEAEMLNAKYLLVQTWISQVEGNHSQESVPSKRKVCDPSRGTEQINAPPTMDSRSPQGNVPYILLYIVLNRSIAKIVPVITEVEHPLNILPTKQREDASARLVVRCLGYLGDQPYTPDHSDSPQCLPPLNVIACHDERPVDQSGGVAQKTLLASRCLYQESDVPSSDVPQPLGSAVTTSMTVEKPNVLVTDYQQPLVPLVNRKGSGTKVARSAACLEANTTSGGLSISPPQPLSTLIQSTSSPQFQYEKPGLQHSPAKGTADIQQPAFSSPQTTPKSQGGSLTASQCAVSLAGMSNTKERVPLFSKTRYPELTLSEQDLLANTTVSSGGGDPGATCGQCEYSKALPIMLTVTPLNLPLPNVYAYNSRTKAVVLSANLRHFTCPF